MGRGPSAEGENRNAIAAGCVAVLLVSANYVLFGDISINFADGGFLWYGVERTAAGEVPLRDFQAYEPGRYYWAAMWSRVLGDGLLALRLSTAIFQMLGLGCGLLVAHRLVSHPLWLLPIGILLLLWMFPRYKIFEPSLAMMAVYVALRVLEARNLSWLFAAGVFVGLVSFIGRNHTLYAGLGILSLTLWLRPRGSETFVWKGLPVLAAGGCIGAIPLAGMMLFVPGFASSFWDSILFFIEHGANLPVSIPWPWQVDYAGMAWTHRAAKFSLGATFMLAPVVYCVGLVVAFRSGRDPLSEQRAHRHVLIAATAIGIFYFHHAANRSDASHLAQAIHPMILASLAIPGALGWSNRRPAALAIWSAVVLITISYAPIGNSAFLLPWQAETKSLVRLTVARDELRLQPGRALWISGIERVVRAHIREDEPLFIAPYFPGLYVALGRKSPVWDLYMLWKADKERQNEMIVSLNRQHVNWALIATGAVDGNDDLRFQRTHERVWEHFKSQFEIVSDPSLPRGLSLFHRRP